MGSVWLEPAVHDKETDRPHRYNEQGRNRAGLQARLAREAVGGRGKGLEIRRTQDQGKRQLFQNIDKEQHPRRDERCPQERKIDAQKGPQGWMSEEPRGFFERLADALESGAGKLQRDREEPHGVGKGDHEKGAADERQQRELEPVKRAEDNEHAHGDDSSGRGVAHSSDAPEEPAQAALAQSHRIHEESSEGGDDNGRGEGQRKTADEGESGGETAPGIREEMKPGPVDEASDREEKSERHRPKHTRKARAAFPPPSGSRFMGMLPASAST